MNTEKSTKDKQDLVKNPCHSSKVVQLPLWGDADASIGGKPQQLPRYTQQIKLWVELAQKTNDPAAYIAGILEKAGIYPKNDNQEPNSSSNTDSNSNQQAKEQANQQANQQAKELVFGENGMPYYKWNRSVTIIQQAAHGNNLEQFKQAYELFLAGTKTSKIVQQVQAPPASVYRWVRRFRELNAK
ncbi:MAG: hypothetical protein AB1847_18450 [bacterium]